MRGISERADNDGSKSGSIHSRVPHWYLTLGGALLFGLGVCAISSASANSSDNARAPFFAPEIQVISSDAKMVTGGDALVEVNAKLPVLANRIRVELNGSDVTAAFTRESAIRFRGLVKGFNVGINTLIASTNLGPRTPPLQSAKLLVKDYPVSGPVFSGPKQEPFFCQTEAAGLGPPENDECFAETQVVYRYRTTAGTFASLADPHERPADLATVTVHGKELPYIVRLERGVINRGIYEIAAIYDGADPSPLREHKRLNNRLMMTFGGGGNVGYRQGTATAGVLNNDALSRGFVVASNSLMVAQTADNFVVNAETAMMTKERVIETYGPMKYTIGFGGSGGSIIQYAIAHAYPTIPTDFFAAKHVGILDGILPSFSFPDSMSAQLALDCTLLVNYINTTAEGQALTDAQRLAISGLGNFQSCQLLGTVAANTVGASTGCDPIVPISIRYNPVTNPKGVRCSPADGLTALIGTNPKTGFAEPNFDNDGIQYGLGALQSGVITAEQFVDLNKHMGGLDSNSVLQSQRSSVSAQLIQRSMASGLLTVTLNLGGQPYTPTIDLRTDDDYIFDIHQAFWSTAEHDRLVRDGVDPRIQSRWIWAPNDKRDHTAEAIDAMSEWLRRIAADPFGGSAAQKAVRDRPRSAADRCWADPNAPANTDYAECSSAAFPPVKDLRMVAGGPATADVIWCTKKPLNRADYTAPFTNAQWSRLKATFPNGVCDYSRPNRHAVPFAGIWQTYN